MRESSNWRHTVSGYTAVLALIGACASKAEHVVDAAADTRPGAGGSFVSSGGTSGSGGQPGSGGGGAPGSGGQEGGATGSGTGAKTGSVTVYVSTGNRYGAPYTAYGASASFTDDAQATAQQATNCQITVVAPCTITTCVMNGVVGQPDAAAAPLPPSAGDISITGGSEAVALDVDAATHLYSTASGSSVLFHSGDLLTFKASGADVPAFQDTVTAPESIVLITPQIPVGVGLVYYRDNPTQFAWSNGAASQVYIVINDNDPYVSHRAVCEFSASAGTAAIPYAALNGFSTSNSVTGGTISIYSKATKTIGAGDYGISLSAAIWATDTQQNIALTSINVL